VFKRFQYFKVPVLKTFIGDRISCNKMPGHNFSRLINYKKEQQN